MSKTSILEKAEKALEFLKTNDNSNRVHELQQHAGVLGQCMGAIGGHPSLVGKFSDLLQRAIPILLGLCSHSSAEVRLVGDEALNRVVIGGMPFHASKVHLHLNNNIIATKSSRWLRAALSRICLGRGWLRAGSGRGRLFAQNTFPKLKDTVEKVADATVIAEKGDVLLMECMEANLPRIVKALSPFATKDEMFGLLTSLLVHIDSSIAPIRRSSANCVADLCQYHQKKFITHVYNTAIDALTLESASQNSVVGWFGALRILFHTNSINELPPDIMTAEKCMKMYQVCLHYIESNTSDHNIHNASMECLNVLLTDPSSSFRSALLSLDGPISINITTKERSNVKGHCRSVSSVSMVQSIMSTASSTINLSEDLLMSEQSDSFAFHGALQLGNMSQQQTPFRSMEDLSIKGINTPDSPCDSMISDINTERMTSEQISSYVNEKFENKQDEKDDVQSDESEIEEEKQFSKPNQLKLNIGNFYDADVPLKFCARLLASRFLLTGYSGQIISDRSVRVSVKASAISCLSSIAAMYPQVLMLFLDIEGDLAAQNVSANSEQSNVSNNERLNDFVLERNICYQESMTDSYCQDLLSKSIDIMSQASGGGSNISGISHKQTSSAAIKRDKYKAAVQESTENSSSLANVPSNILDSKPQSTPFNLNQNQMGASFMSGDSVNLAMTASNFTMGSNMTASNDPLSTDFLMTTSIDPLTSSLDLEMKFDHFGESTTSLENESEQLNVTTQYNLEQKLHDMFLKNDGGSKIVERQISNESKSSTSNSLDVQDQLKPLNPRDAVTRKHSSERNIINPDKVLETVEENCNSDNVFVEDSHCQFESSQSGEKNANCEEKMQKSRQECYEQIEETEFVHQHLSELILLLENHSDPQIRGLVRVCIGSFLNSALDASSGDFLKWLPFCSLPKKFADKMNVNNLIAIMTKGLSDEIHSCVNNSLNAIGKCITMICSSYQNSVVSLVLNALRCIETNPYWLCKVNLCKLYEKLPFEKLCIILPDWHSRSLRILDIIICLLGDQDQRVRKAASEAIAKIIPTLLTPSSFDVNKLITNLAKKQTENLFFLGCQAEVNLLADFKQSFVLSDLPGPLKDIREESNDTNKWNDKNDYLFRNLKTVLSTLTFKLMESNCKYFLQGCLESLLEISLQYPPTKYPESYSELGLLDACLQLLEYRTLPVSCCEALIAFVTQIYAVEAWNTIRRYAEENKYDTLPPLKPSDNLKPIIPPKPWFHFGSGNFASKAETLLRITLKLLNVIIHIIEDAVPIVIQQKSSSIIPSSPIRRRTGNNDHYTSDLTPKRHSGSSTGGDVQLPDDKNTLRKKVPYNSISGHFTSIGYFANDAVFMRLYGNLRAAYCSHKVNLESPLSVFLKFVSTTLDSVAIQLEVMTDKEAGKVAEEVLYYLKCILPIKPDYSVFCVTQMLKCLSSINMTAYRNDLKTFFTKNNAADTNEWDTKSDSKSSTLSFYREVMIVNNSEKYVNFDSMKDYDDVSLNSPRHISNGICWSSKSFSTDNHLQIDKDCYLNVKNFTKCKIDKKWSTNKQDLARYLRLIEPVVIQALKSYTIQNNISLQCRVLELLNQLLALRVNYCLLDSDQVFIEFVLKQLENIEHHEILNCGELVRCIFTFLVHLSAAKHHTKQLMDIPKLIQLCDGLMASGVHSECVESLHPVAYRVFVSGQNLQPGSLQQTLDAQVTKEVIFAMLQKLMHDVKVVKLMSSILIFSEEHSKSYFLWSRLACDTLLQLLKQRCADINSVESFTCMEKLFDCIHREVLFDQSRIETIIKIMFDKPPDHEHASNETKERWLATLLLFLRKVISNYPETEILLSLNYLKTAHISPAAIFFNLQDEIDPLNVQTVNENCANLSPDVIFVRFLFRIITYSLVEFENCDERNLVELGHSDRDVIDGKNSYWCSLTTSFVCQVKHLLYLKDGCKFPLLAKMAQTVLQNEQSGLNTGLYTPEENIPLERLSAICTRLSWRQPLLTVHWCHLLMRLKFLDQKYWSTLFGFLQKPYKQTENNKQRNLFNEILQIGCFMSLCEYFVDNGLDNEVIYLTWLLVNRTHLIVRYYSEDIVKELIDRVNDNTSASGLLLQAIAARCHPCIKGTFGIKVCKILSGCHSTQSGSLLLFICRLIGTLHPSNSFPFARLAIDRCKYLASLTAEEIESQLPKEDLQIALDTLQKDHVHIRHPTLIQEVNILASTFFDLSPLDLSQDRPINAQYINTTAVDNGWLVNQIKNRCYKNVNKPQIFGKYASIAKLLASLNVEKLNSIVSCPEFDRQIISHTLKLGTDVYIEMFVHRISEWEIIESQKRKEQIKLQISNNEENIVKETGSNMETNILNIANNFVRFKKIEPQSQFFVSIQDPTEMITEKNDQNASPSKFGKLKIEIRDEKTDIILPEMDPLLSVSLLSLERSVQTVVALSPRQSRPLSQFDNGNYTDNQTMDKYTRRCFQVFRDKLFHQELVCIHNLVNSYLECMKNIEAALENVDCDVCEKVMDLFLPKSLAKSLMSFSVISLQYTLYLIKLCEDNSLSDSVSFDSTLDICIVNASNTFMLDSVWKELNVDTNVTRVQSAINCLYTYVRYSVKDSHPIAPVNLVQSSEDSSKSTSELASTCDRFLTLVQYWEDNFYNKLNGKTTNIMSYKIQHAVENLLVQLCRCDFASSFTLIPSLAWGDLEIFENITKPTMNDMKNEAHASNKLSPLIERRLKKQIVIPITSLQDMDVLEQYLFRVNFIGWTNKKSFEEIWVSLLGALQGNGTHWAVRGMMQLLLSTNANQCTRDGPAASHSNQRLKSVSLECKLYKKLFSDTNLESISFDSQYHYSQFSLDYLRHASGLNDIPDTKVQNALKKSKKFLQTSVIDNNSCLQLLMDIASQMALPQSGWGLGARNALLCCIVNVSDVFSSLTQWQWLSDQLSQVSLISDPSDILTHQYLTIGVAKVNSMLDMFSLKENQEANPLIAALSSTFAPIRTAALHASIMHLSACKESMAMFAGKDNLHQIAKQSFSFSLETQLFLTIQPHLIPQARVSLYEQSLCWTALFVLIDCGNIDLLKVASDFLLANKTHFCFDLILQGVCRVVMNGKVSLPNEMKGLVLKAINSHPESCYQLLPLLVVQIYSSVDGQPPDDALEPEQLLNHLQTTAALHGCMAHCPPSHCVSVCGLLSRCLADHLPPPAVINRVSQEFVDSCSKIGLAPHEDHIGRCAEAAAEVVFKVFQAGIQQSQLSILSGWLFDVLGHLVQGKISPELTPICLLCLITCSSGNPFIRSMAPAVFNIFRTQSYSFNSSKFCDMLETKSRNERQNQCRELNMSYSDRRLLCLAAVHSGFSKIQIDKLKTFCTGKELLKDLFTCLGNENC